jgi:hypothetical protein
VHDAAGAAIWTVDGDVIGLTGIPLQFTEDIDSPVTPRHVHAERPEFRHRDDRDRWREGIIVRDLRQPA